MAQKKEKKPIKPREANPETDPAAAAPEDTAPKEEPPVCEPDAPRQDTGNPPEEAQPPKDEGQEALKKAESELAAMKDQYVRLAAEYDNFRKRTAREKEVLYEDAVADTVAAMLPPLDSLERALSFADADPKVLKDGLAMVSKQMLDALKKLSVEEISTAEGFEPTLHNAIMHEEDESLPPNTVAEVFQKGYKLKERIIRHSLVKVVN